MLRLAAAARAYRAAATVTPPKPAISDAAVLAHLGRLNEARAATRAGFALNPTFTMSRYRDRESSDNPTYLAQREHSLDGMRKAGVPEG